MKWSLIILLKEKKQKNARSLKGSFNRWPVIPSSYSDVWTKERIDIIFRFPVLFELQELFLFIHAKKKEEIIIIIKRKQNNILEIKKMEKHMVPGRGAMCVFFILLCLTSFYLSYVFILLLFQFFWMISYHIL